MIIANSTIDFYASAPTRVMFTRKRVILSLQEMVGTFIVWKTNARFRGLRVIIIRARAAGNPHVAAHEGVSPRSQSCTRSYANFSTRVSLSLSLINSSSTYLLSSNFITWKWFVNSHWKLISLDCSLIPLGPAHSLRDQQHPQGISNNVGYNKVLKSTSDKWEHYIQ